MNAVYQELTTYRNIQCAAPNSNTHPPFSVVRGIELRPSSPHIDTVLCSSTATNQSMDILDVETIPPTSFAGLSKLRCPASFSKWPGPGPNYQIVLCQLITTTYPSEKRSPESARLCRLRHSSKTLQTRRQTPTKQCQYTPVGGHLERRA